MYVCMHIYSETALATMRNALDSYVIRGVTTNISFLRELTDHPRFIDGDMSTNFIAEEYPNGYSKPDLYGSEVPSFVAAILSQ